MSLIAALTTIGTAVTFGAATGTTAAVIGGVTAGTVTGATVGTIKAAASGEDIGKGALMGAVAGGVTGGVAPGLGAAVAAPIASGVGSAAAPIVTGAVVGGVSGAAGGAAGSAVGGQDVGKGALMGGATGAVAGGTMGAIGPAPSEVPSIGVANPSTPAEGALSNLGTGEFVGSNAGAAQFDSAIGSVPGAAGYTPPATLGGAPTTATSSGLGIGDIGPKIGIQPATALGSAEPTGVVGGPLAQIKTGVTAAGLAGATDYAGNSIIDAQDAAAKAAKEDEERGLAFASQGSSGLAGVRAAGLPDGTGPLGGLGSIGRATGGITALAHGGQVALGDGAYIIPADVVSALGNGSSKAGADYLRRLMIEVRKEAVGRQGMGAAKKHVS